MKIRLTFLLVLAFSGTSSVAQVGITALPFLEISNIARSEALAGADVADWSSLSGLHLNPALLGGDESLIFSTPFYSADRFRTGTDWFPALHSDFEIQTPFMVANFDKYSIGFKHKKLIFGQGLTAEDSPDIIGSFESEEVSNSLVASFQINSKLKIGIGFNWFKSDLYSSAVNIGTSDGGNIEAKGRSFDIGLVSRFPSESNDFFITPSLGLAINDIGRTIDYGFGDEPLPTTFRTGFGVNILSKKEVSGLSMIGLQTFGALSKMMAGYDDEGNPYEGLGAVFKTWKPYQFYNGIENRELSVKDQLRSHLGVELTFLEIVHIRAGRFYENEYNGERYYTSRGIGLHYKFISLDYTRIFDRGEAGFLNMKFYQFSVHIPL
jgi:hypothetical protein